MNLKLMCPNKGKQFVGCASFRPKGSNDDICIEDNIRRLYIGIICDILCTINHPKPKFCKKGSNGLRYLRWGLDGEAVQPEK